ncbi:MAG: hypothetical protein D3924_19610, partial [Candidatus Electrothrix sp. AR4]|nr:hypothetical protein [Candidatus Electrothrix sp. AR4]
GDFPGDADKGEAAFQHGFDGTGQLGNAEDFLLVGVEMHGALYFGRGDPYNRPFLLILQTV